MNNLHFLVVSAQNAEEAISIARGETYSWGNDNNWRRFGGCVSEHDEVFIVDEGSGWTPEPNHTIEMINSQIEEWLKPDEYKKQMFEKCAAGTNENSFMWINAKDYCNHMYELALHGKDTFDVLEDSFHSWELDEEGVTQLKGEDEPSSKKYVVFLNMNS